MHSDPLTGVVCCCDVRLAAPRMPESQYPPCIRTARLAAASLLGSTLPFHGAPSLPLSPLSCVGQVLARSRGVPRSYLLPGQAGKRSEEPSFHPQIDARSKVLSQLKATHHTTCTLCGVLGYQSTHPDILYTSHAQPGCVQCLVECCVPAHGTGIVTATCLTGTWRSRRL